jgi:plasmid stabilization system protein ParE
MGETTFRVVFAADAWSDLEELSEYWISRGEGWRAEKYSRDLVQLAETELGDAIRARRGRNCRSRRYPGAREILAFGVYRIIYRVDESVNIVKVLRFWPAHRDEPGRDP